MFKMFDRMLDKFIDYMIETFWNKVLAIVLALCGGFLFVYTGELTIAIITAVVVVVLFFENKNCTNF